MSAEFVVRAPGAYASIQDPGRRGLRRFGVPWAGTLAPRTLRLANALVGNAESAAAIECFDGGFEAIAEGAPLSVAVAGDAQLEIVGADGRRPAAPWCSHMLADGERLRLLRVMRGRVAVVAVAGLDLAPVLGSCSTYARAGLGGIDGAPLQAGSRLCARAAATSPARRLPSPPAIETGPIRVVPGPQADHFADASLAAFFDTPYRVTAEADRMGVRLDGPAIAHRDATEIVSDATVPGSIQVPGNGRPIVLLADGQTAGGYPKIATVISADLPRLANLRPGDTVRFAAVTVADGESIARAAEGETRALIASIQLGAPGEIDLAALYDANLAGNAVHALAPEYRPLGDAAAHTETDR